VERLGLRAVEVATHPREGAELESLERAMRGHGARVCWLMPTLQNPLGATMPVPKKRELVALLARHDAMLVEDDVYSELHDGEPSPAAKAFDKAGRVMHCGSFSKSLAPGYRLGWCAPGRAFAQVERLKLTTSIATSLPVQDGIAEFLKQGGYDHHLRGLRAKLGAQRARMLQAIAAEFPEGTRVTRPDGGYFVWVQLPGGVDAMELSRTALARGVSVAPGPIFSAHRAFRDCLRINCGHPWTDAVARAVALLGRLARG